LHETKESGRIKHRRAKQDIDHYNLTTVGVQIQIRKHDEI